jgi:hypothetical protein
MGEIVDRLVEIETETSEINRFRRPNLRTGTDRINTLFLRFAYTMYEPHLVDHSNQHGRPRGDSSLLEELDKIAPIKAFDAFPKVSPGIFSTNDRSNPPMLANLDAGGFLPH